MLKITRETDYGIVMMAYMARDPGRSYSATSLAEERGLSQPMASKILKSLARAGLLASRRGARGGYSLARPPEAISAADVIDALEGPIAMTECGTGACSHQDRCDITSHWERINSAVRRALEGISLRELSRPVAVAVRLPATIASPQATAAKPL